MVSIFLSEPEAATSGSYFLLIYLFLPNLTYLSKSWIFCLYFAAKLQ
jgi:hypothetical protein